MSSLKRVNLCPRKPGAVMKTTLELLAAVLRNTLGVFVCTRQYIYNDLLYKLFTILPIERLSAAILFLAFQVAAQLMTTVSSI